MSAHTVVLKEGLMTMQVCTDRADLADAVADVNLIAPTGISNGWQRVADDDSRLKGDPPVVQCADDPTRRHFVVEC